MLPKEALVTWKWPLSFHGPNNCRSNQMGEMGTDYTQRNVVVPAILQQAQLVQQQGVSLCYAPEVPQLKNTWVKKEGPIQQYFHDFVR